MRNSNGKWASFYDTLIAMKALSKFSEKQFSETEVLQTPSRLVSWLSQLFVSVVELVAGLLLQMKKIYILVFIILLMKQWIRKEKL